MGWGGFTDTTKVTGKMCQLFFKFFWYFMNFRFRFWAQKSAKKQIKDLPHWTVKFVQVVRMERIQGDSGGGVFMRREDSTLSNNTIPWYLVGIVSFGSRDCGNGSAGIYTRVSEYINWIKSHMWFLNIKEITLKDLNRCGILIDWYISANENKFIS